MRELSHDVTVYTTKTYGYCIPLWKMNRLLEFRIQCRAIQFPHSSLSAPNRSFYDPCDENHKDPIDSEMIKTNDIRSLDYS